MKWTLDQALTNWRMAFDSGLYTSARAWWTIVENLRSGGVGWSGKEVRG